jgi:kumamolisin
MMTHHVREQTRNGRTQAMGQLPLNRMITLNIVLPLRDRAGLKNLLSEIYNPDSPSYRHFLTVPEFTARFGPTQAEYDEVVLFAKMNGFTVIGGSRDGMDVQIKGPVSAVEAAFHVSIGTYRHPTEARTFYAPDREPTTSPSHIP